MFNKIVFLSLLLVVASCNETTEKIVNEPEDSSISLAMKEIQQKVEKINASELTVANSLSYRHNDGSTEEVFAYLNDKQEIVKLEEKFKIGKDGDSGVRFFYLENGKKIMTTERFVDTKFSNGKFRERQSFYDASGKPFATQDRVTMYEEDLEQLEFSKSKTFDCPLQTAENVLNQKGVFATTFQGFASDGPIDYLIVGGPGESGYASALAVQYEDETIKYLKGNQVRMVNTPLLVEFEKMLDERKLEFQVLTRVQMNK